MSLQFSNQGIAQEPVWVAVPLPLDFCGSGICPVLLAWEQPEPSHRKRGAGRMLILPMWVTAVRGAPTIIFQLS